MSAQPTNSSSSQNLTVTVEWSAAPAKKALKEGYGSYTDVATTAMEEGLKAGVKAAAKQAPQYASLLECANPKIEDAAAKTNEAYKAYGGTAVDKAYETSDSLASRTDQYYGCYK